MAAGPFSLSLSLLPGATVLLSQEVAALGVAFSPNCSVINGHTQAALLAAFCDQSSYFKQASTESNALVSVAVTQ